MQPQDKIPILIENNDPLPLDDIRTLGQFAAEIKSSLDYVENTYTDRTRVPTSRINPVSITKQEIERLKQTKTPNASHAPYIPVDAVNVIPVNNTPSIPAVPNDGQMLLPGIIPPANQQITILDRIEIRLKELTKSIDRIGDILEVTKKHG